MEQPEIEKLQQERDEYLQGWQRAKADFANYKKEEVTRLEHVAKYSTEDFVREMIGVLDSFDLGISAMEKQGAVEKGIYMIRTQIEDALKKRGLQRISWRAGDPYDPRVAEAVAEMPSDHPEGSMVEEIEPGYMLHEKVLRPIRVKIAKSK